MKKLIFAVCALFLFTFARAQTNPLTKFTDSAKASHKNILVQFSGSDWCIPCIKMEKAIFEQTAFTNYANDSLITVHADFPRVSKLSKQQQKQNDLLAEQFNKKGSFPYTVLLDESGKVLKVWNGYKDMTAETFVSELKSAAQTDVK